MQIKYVKSKSYNFFNLTVSFIESVETDMRFTFLFTWILQAKKEPTLFDYYGTNSAPSLLMEHDSKVGIIFLPDVVWKK